LDLGNLTSDFSLISSVAIILGTVFVVVQLRQNNTLIQAANEQAQAAAAQAKLTTEQMKQNNDIADMDLIMRLYEFANSGEVQSAWHTVLNTKVETLEDFQKLQKADQVSYFQIAALFESLGVLVERGFVKPELIADMFLTELAWERMEGFVTAMREHHGEEENCVGFERLYKVISHMLSSSNVSPSSLLR